MSSSIDLHIFFFPFLAAGHMIPLVDMATILAGRRVKATIVTTYANAPLIQATINRSSHHINLLTIPFPSAECGLPEGVENTSALPTPDVSPEFIKAINLLRDSFEKLLRSHRPDCIMSDAYYAWTTDLAAEVGIPRIVFHGSGCFPAISMGTLMFLKLHERVSSDAEPFVIPGLPHRIEMTSSELPDFIRGTGDWAKFVESLGEAQLRSYGIVMNTFDELEPGYEELFKKATGNKAWFVGPLSLQCRAARADGGHASADWARCLEWLDSQDPGSVLFLCFGSSLNQFTCSQLGEIAKGLAASGHPFVWVVRNAGAVEAEWMPEGFEEGKGMVVRGWVPQTMVLEHKAVGGFLTHCGWNSFIEGASAGLPMIAWPLFGEQFFNEKLLVEVLKIGIRVGAKVCTTKKEERNLVSGEEIRKAVEKLMGEGEEADGWRRRAKRIREMGKRSVEVGGASYNQVGSFIQDLINLKNGAGGQD